MLNKLKSAIAAAFPAPAVAVPTRDEFAVVPVVRGNAQMGALDRMPDQVRPSLLPAPPLRTQDQEARLTHSLAAAHAQNFAATNGFVAAGLERVVTLLIGGEGLRPSISPRADVLGWTPEFARKWANAAEQVLADWGDDAQSCDAAGRAKFAALQGQAVLSWLRTGDIMASLDFGPKKGAAWRTSIQMIDPVRVKMPGYGMPGVSVSDGIEFDERGRAVAVHVLDYYSRTPSTRFPIFSPSGKKLFHHGFDGAAGQVRGISPVSAATGGLLQSLMAMDAAILNAQASAMMLGTVTSDLPSDALIKAFGGDDAQDPLGRMMSGRIAWHEGLKEARADVELGRFGRVVHLSTGEKLELHGIEKNFDRFAEIAEQGLREVARVLGISYAMLTSDRSKSSYSSLQHDAAEMRAIVERRRKVLIEPFVEWVAFQVLEEAVVSGEIEFPVSNRELIRSTPLERWRRAGRYAMRAQWLGAAVQNADELKAAEASRVKVQMGLSSLSDEIASTGKDPEQVFDQIARDREELKRRGIYLPQHTDKRPVIQKGPKE